MQFISLYIVPFFPLNYRVRKSNPMSLIFMVILYTVFSLLVNGLLMLLGWIPVLHAILLVVNYVVCVYCVLGILLAILTFLGKIR